MHIDLHSLFAGAATYGVLAYAAQTFPTPQNAYARWAVGVLQFALSNREKALQAMSGKEAAK